MSYGDFITRYPTLALVSILIVTLLLGSQIKSIETTSDTDVYLPDNDETNIYREIKREYGSSQIALVIAESSDGDVFTREAMIDILRVEWEIENDSHINRVLQFPNRAGNVISLVDMIAAVIGELTDTEEITRADMYYNLTTPNSTWVQQFNEWFGVLESMGYIDNWQEAIYFDDNCIKAALHLIFNIIPQIERDMNQSFGIPNELYSFILKIISTDFVYKNSEIHGDYRRIRASATLAIVQMNNSLPRELVMDAQDKIDLITKNMKTSVVKFRAFGPKLITRDINDSANRSLALLMPIAFLIIIIILIYSFRTLIDTVLSLLSLAFAIIWMYGIANVFEFSLTTISVAAPILLVGLGIDYAIHIILHYRYELRSGYRVDDAIKRTVGSVGAAILLSVLTTIAGFMSNIFSDLTAIIHFGILCAAGIGSSFVISNTFIPAAKLLIDRRREKKGKPVLPKSDIKKMQRDFEVGWEGTSDIKKLTPYSIGAYGANKSPSTITAVAVIITIVAAYLASNLGYSFEDKEFLPDDTPIKDTISYLETNFDISTSYVSIWIQGDITDPNLVYAINGTITNMYDDRYVIKPGNVPQTESIITYMRAYYTTTKSKAFKTLYNSADVVGNDNIPDKYLDIIYQWIYEDEYSRQALRQYLHYSNAKTGLFDSFLDYYITVRGVNETFKEAYNAATEDWTINETERDNLLDICFANEQILEDIEQYFSKRMGIFDGTIIRVYVVPMKNEEIPKLIDELRSDTETRVDYITPSLASVSSKIIITDGPILSYIIMKSIQENQRNSMIIMIIIAAIMLSAVFRINMRSATLGIITTLPVIFVVVWILASLYLLGLSINVMTTMIAALTIGLGIDYSIHVSHQFVENLSVLKDRKEAMIITANTTGKALMGASLTTIGGFAILTLSPLPPLRQFGGITALTIVFSIIAAVYILPSMLMLWSKGKEGLYVEDLMGYRYMEYQCLGCNRKTILRLKEKNEDLICPYCSGKLKYLSVVNIKALERAVLPYLYIIRYRCITCNYSFELKATKIKNIVTCPKCGNKNARVVLDITGRPKAKPLSPIMYYTPTLSYLGPRAYMYAPQYYYNYLAYTYRTQQTMMYRNIGGRR